MGVNPRSDPWAAFCFDEACYLWGRHVDAELNEAVRKAKNDKEAQRKGLMVIQKLMRDDDEVIEQREEGEEGQKPKTPEKGKFRDPAAFFAQTKQK